MSYKDCWEVANSRTNPNIPMQYIEQTNWDGFTIFFVNFFK